jgi:hypothetical protein
MKEIFLEYAKKGVMTKAELAWVLRCRPSHIDTLRRRGIIHAILELGRPYKFDPMDVYARLFEPKRTHGSVTTEKRNGGNPKSGGFRKCL